MTTVEATAQNATEFTLADTEQSVAQRFEKLVERYGDRLAITDASGSVTYSALNQLANRFAHQIIARVPAEKPARVALYLEKGIPQIAAILAILKCGHTYVPIDPAFPQARNRYIYQESQAALIIGNGASLKAARELAGDDTAILNLDSVSEHNDSNNPDIPVSPDTLAYIIYTSGSTGTPKGVVQNNRNLLHGCMRRSNLQNVTPEDRMTLLYSCSVIASVYCIFGALLNGAALFPYDFHREGVEKLADWLKSRRITIYHSVASLFREFAAQYRPEEDDDFPIRLVTFGGERVLTSDIELARKVFSPKIEFYTGLGSTETGTIRYFHIGPDTELDGDVVPIGYPVEGVDILLLDENGAEVAPGEVGEITARSRYLALGYWKNLEASAKAFSRDRQDPRITIYRTGDLGQMDADGLLHHRGRRDFQVKIRGFRVEVSEVEARLLAHPDIAEAVVVAREHERETQLVAYLVPVEGAAPNVQQLRDHMSEALNYYMIPTIYVQLEQLPKTPNNKVDRNALPSAAASQMLPGTPYIAAQGPTEARLVAFCQELLGKETVSITDNFFALGGHSLNATQLLARINEQFDVNLDMRSIFEEKDLRALATRIDTVINTRTSNGIDTGAEEHVAEKGITRAPANTRIPLSSAQKRMWLAEKLWGNSQAYKISNSVLLRGALNIAALEQAIAALLERHDVLRTVFPEDAEGPYQQVLPHTSFSLNTIDLRREPQKGRATRALAYCQKILREPDSLEQGPLFHAHLIRIDNETAILALSFHHIIYDNIWSSGIFFAELGKLYGALNSGKVISLPSQPLQFSDYAYWEQQRETVPTYHQQLNYWRDQLSALPSPLDVPADRVRPEAPDFSGGMVTFKLPATLTAELHLLARQESATGFMLLLAAWQLLLHRYTQQSDIIVGTPSGRRPHTQTESMIGLFINTLVMRTDFSQAKSFRDLLQRVRTTTIDAFSNDQVPFEDLVAELNPPRASGEPPFFRHLFIHRKQSAGQWKLPGLRLTPLTTHAGGAKFDLTLSMLESDSTLSGTLEYRTALFDRETAKNLTLNLEQLLSSIVAMPDKPLAELPLLAPEEHRLVCRQWNQTRTELPVEPTVPQLFDQQVHIHATKTAVTGSDEQLSYQQLNLRADGFAQELRVRGVKPGTLVAICMQRSTNLMVALLAVWKAGGAFVPLDPMFPPERLGHILDDSGTKLLVTDSASRDKLPAFTGETILLDESAEFETSEKHPQQTASSQQAQPNAPAYVIYTSGSTGRPKGVQISQRSLVNFLCSMQEKPGFSADDTLLALTTVCFDIALLELFLPLLSGGRLVIQDWKQSRDPKAIQATLCRESISVMQATPSTWRMLLDHGWQGNPGVRVLCGGEAMGKDLAGRLLDCGLQVWNLYGPTETTIWSSVSAVESPADSAFIGMPIANTTLYVLDTAAQPLPAGVPGELCIGGEGVALGYYNREELTRERFFSCQTLNGERLYRTGDLVVRHRDGRIEYLGRMDHQVKIRGFRVEVGEIEARIAENPAVRQCVVIAHDDESGGKYLVAYLLRQQAETSGQAISELPDSETLRQQLRLTLPEYMVPSVFVPVASFPLTPNGKVDRKAFSPPSASATIPSTEVHDTSGTAIDLQTKAIDETTKTIATPADIHKTIQSVFESQLKTSVTNLETSFFDLGGHSLSALNVIARLNKLFALELPPTLLFDFPSVSALAQAISQFQDGKSEAQVLATASVDEKTELQVNSILDRLRDNQQASDLPSFPHGMKMQRSKIASMLLAPMFAIKRGLVRIALEKLILKLEGGSTFSLTMRDLYRKYYDIEVGDFTSVRFEPSKLKRYTRVGKYSTIYPTVQFQTADHPRNTLSTHGIFYHSRLGFSSGYELDRTTIEVGNDVWIGDGAKILYPTQKIGDGAVIAAGAVVIEDVPPYAVVAGYPARVVRYRFSQETIPKLLEIQWWTMSGKQLHHSRREFLKPLEGERIR
ncbi:amino acid adenylation domain-containing protein [Microbulbifer agarilyticus]|uniref:non-ribosomal peptide synthetase n=1 Tax=Microbulbifer agarilyticus TaxID=260552 RepID=UPI001C97E461|nr:non-ribosomal peptide synthetase [Microbulbifer agarilyticus]MBY6191807.1 amino acid adenylation domain-containing protein [Microbulbifer agarilyticus]